GSCLPHAGESLAGFQFDVGVRKCYHSLVAIAPPFRRGRSYAQPSYCPETMRQVREVDPGTLRLPPERADGPDPFKLLDQYREFGDSIDGMPPLWVIEGVGGEYLIVDGVTRASRAFMY